MTVRQENGAKDKAKRLESKSGTKSGTKSVSRCRRRRAAPRSDGWSSTSARTGSAGKESVGESTERYHSAPSSDSITDGLKYDSLWSTPSLSLNLPLNLNLNLELNERDQAQNGNGNGGNGSTERVRLELTALLDRVWAEMVREDFAVRRYLRTMVALRRLTASTDSFKASTADGDIEMLRMTVNALFVLSEGHYAFDGRRGLQIGDFYAQKSLDILEGAAVPKQHALWREMLNVLTLRAQFRTERAQFAAALSDLDRARSVMHSANKRGDVAEHDGHFEVALLHQLIAVHDAQGDYTESARCSKQLLSVLERPIMSSSGSGSRSNHSLEAKAWLSCTLMLCTNDVAAVNEGRSMYRDILLQSERRWTSNAKVDAKETPYRWYTYFAVHFVAMREWTESNELVLRMLEWRHDGGRFDCASTHRALRRYTHYLRENEEREQSLSTLPKRQNKQLNALMLKLHSKQSEVVKVLMDQLRTGKWRKVGDDGDGEGMTVEIEDFKSLKVDRAPNVVAMLVEHILIFRAVGNRQKADEILFSAVTVDGDRKRLNRQSVYFAKFETVQFGENEVHSLLNLC